MAGSLGPIHENRAVRGTHSMALHFNERGRDVWAPQRDGTVGVSQRQHRVVRVLPHHFAAAQPRPVLRHHLPRARVLRRSHDVIDQCVFAAVLTVARSLCAHYAREGTPESRAALLRQQCSGAVDAVSSSGNLERLEDNPERATQNAHLIPQDASLSNRS
jgi:hypothetical protein